MLQLIITLTSDQLMQDGDSHMAAVTACNSAGLCSTSYSPYLLVDSTPPVEAGFLSPLSWAYGPTPNTTTLHLLWTSFHDDESDVTGYNVTAGRAYNGDEVSRGVVTVTHDNSSTTQSLTLTSVTPLTPGDVLYLSVRAHNLLGMSSATVRAAYSVQRDNSTHGTLLLVRHSCSTAYCTRDCTCAARGRACVGGGGGGGGGSCRELSVGDPALGGFSLTSSIIGLSARWVGLSSRWVGMSSRWVGLSSRWVGLSSRWVGLSSRWVGLSSRWVGLSSRWMGLCWG